MPGFVHHIPIATTLVALLFAPRVYRRWRERRPAPHLWWWAVGITLYGVGTLTESFTTLFGWNETVFRSWYVSGALLGGAPLAQGTVYLFFSRRVANWTAVALGSVVVVAALAVFLSPIQVALVEPHRLTGSVLEWQWARLFSPFINTYAFIFLVGGAAWSAWRYRKGSDTRHRFIGNVLIAVGALLPGIGGMATRAGHTEVLYVMEFIGLILIWAGYRANIQPSSSREPTGSAPRVVAAERYVRP